MQKSEYLIQDPLIFASCFRRSHFSRHVLEGIFRQRVNGRTLDDVTVVDFMKNDGTVGYAALIKDFAFINSKGITRSTAAIALDMSEAAHFTAAKISASLFADGIDQPTYTVVFTHKLHGVVGQASAPKFALSDVNGNRLFDKHWEYFVCCRYADKLESKYLSTLCRLLRGSVCTMDNAQIICDLATVVATDADKNVIRTVTPELLEYTKARIERIEKERIVASQAAQQSLTTPESGEQTVTDPGEKDVDNGVDS